jgi:hypothetical protein
MIFYFPSCFFFFFSKYFFWNIFFFFKAKSKLNNKEQPKILQFSSFASSIFSFASQKVNLNGNQGK